MRKQNFILLLLACAGLGCTKTELETANPNLKGQITATADPNISGNTIVTVEADSVKMLRNPLTGWALYGSAGVTADFWSVLENITVPGMANPIKAADYASILYIRSGWADFEPTEGQYAWDNNATIKMLIDGAKARGLKLAFRIVVDSRDKPRDFTPSFVRDAGAQGYYTQTGSKTVWSPYPDDPIFQQKYANFIQAFAAKFNDPDVVDFVDGYGLGKWGEAHTVLYLDVNNRASVFNWITDLYTQYFTKVPLAINYHRLIGTTQGWGGPDANSKPLLVSAFNKGYMLRQDAFGMTTYYANWERNMASQNFPNRPIICEGGWLHNGNGYLADPRGYQNWGDVWQGEYDDAMNARVNVMDLRDIKEARSWFGDAYSLVNKFIALGAYRLYPDQLSLPAAVDKTVPIKIAHRWKNLGVGFCPTNLPQWNQKYKVAFALLDKNTLDVKYTFVDTNTDLSKWLKEAPTSYEFSPNLQAVTNGNYTWAVALVDVTKNNQKGLDISAKNNITTTGWLKLMDVAVN